MSDLVTRYGELRRAAGRPTGRHAFDEDAALTPIFHALSRGDEVAEFRRDPLTAPIPVQAFAAAAAPSPRLSPTRHPARRRAAQPPSGRHALLAG